MNVLPGSPIAEAIVTADSVYRAMARVTIMPKEHAQHLINLLRKELDTSEAHERTLIQAFIRYINIEGLS